MKLRQFKFNSVSFVLLLWFQSPLFCFSQSETNPSCHFVYVLKTEGDVTNTQKELEQLVKLRGSLNSPRSSVTTLVSGGRFSSNGVKDWDKLYSILNRWGSLSNLDPSEEIDNTLKLFGKNEFQQVDIGTLKTKENLYDLTWHIFVGKGFWDSGYNQSVIGYLIASANLLSKSNIPFQIKFYCDIDEVQYVRNEFKLGEYYSLLMTNDIEVITY